VQVAFAFMNVRPVALVTGASSGIGLEFARQLAANGHDLVVVARDEPKLKDLAAEVSTEVEVLRADLTDPTDLASVEARLSDASRPVDVLVNNAGFGTMGPFAQLPVEDEEREIRLNVIALVRLTRAALPGMLERKQGGILNVSSIGAFQPGPFNATYSATKAFVTSFTEAVHEEVRGSGVHVIALCPGLTKTGFQAASGATASTMPGFLWQTSEQVVKTALRALRRNHAVSVPGVQNKGAAFLVRVVPRGVVRRMSAGVGRRLRD
jgi:short-subunit dehydrogenase